MDDAWSSRLRDIDLDITPSSFSWDTMDRHELSQYVLDDLLSCPVGCWIIMCIRSGAQGNPTKASYLDQAQSITSSRSKCGMATKSWKMSGNLYHVLQGTISRSTLRDEVTSKNLSRSQFIKYFTNLSGNFGISFEGSSQILSVPWNDVIQYSHIVMFFGKQFNQLRPWGPVFWFKTDPEYAHHVFWSFALEYFGDSRASVQLFAAYKNCMCTIYCKRSLNAVSPSTSTRAKMPTFNFKQARAFQSW